MTGKFTPATASDESNENGNLQNAIEEVRQEYKQADDNLKEELSTIINNKVQDLSLNNSKEEKDFINIVYIPNRGGFYYNNEVPCDLLEINIKNDRYSFDIVRAEDLALKIDSFRRDIFSLNERLNHIENKIKDIENRLP